MLTKIKKWVNCIDSLSLWVGRVSRWFVLLIMVFAAWEVFSRYVLNSPTIWVWDVNTQVLLFLGTMSGAYSMLHNGNVRVDIFYSKLSARNKALVDLLTSIFSFAFIIILLWKGLDMSITSFMMNEHAASYWDPPMYWIKMTIPLGALLMLLQGLAIFVRNLVFAVTGEEMPNKVQQQ